MKNKTTVKTTIKGSENLFVKESVETIYQQLTDKHSFLLLTAINHKEEESRIGIKKSSIKMFK